MQFRPSTDTIAGRSNRRQGISRQGIGAMRCIAVCNRHRLAHIRVPGLPTQQP